MKSNWTKFAAAAAVIVAVVILWVSLVNKSATPAWAIEQSIQALNEVSTIHIRGTCTNELLFENKNDFIKSQGAFEFDLWAKKSSDRPRSGGVRFERGDGLTLISHEETNETYLYYLPEHVVVIMDGNKVMVSPWIDADTFQWLEGETKDWKVSYGKDQDSGRDCAFVTCSYPPNSRSWWLAFDIETKLLVRFKQWHNTDREGSPVLSAEKITYNIELDDSLFDFEIPEGVKVIDQRKHSEQDN